MSEMMAAWERKAVDSPLNLTTGGACVSAITESALNATHISQRLSQNILRALPSYGVALR